MSVVVADFVVIFVLVAGVVPKKLATADLPSTFNLAVAVAVAVVVDILGNCVVAATAQDYR